MIIAQAYHWRRSPRRSIMIRDLIAKVFLEISQPATAVAHSVGSYMIAMALRHGEDHRKNEMTKDVDLPQGAPAKKQIISTASHRLQMVMSDASAEKLGELKDWTEAASYGEVVRRALQFYEELPEGAFFAIEDSAQKEPLTSRVQIVLPQKTLERLDHLRKANTDEELSYSEIIRGALRAYAILVEHRRKRETLRITTSSGEEIVVEPYLFAA